MKEDELKSRTKEFSLRIIKLIQALPKNMVSDVLGKQLLRSATSVSANYRAACRARSRAEFSAKMSIVIEEADEYLFWLELIGDADLMDKYRLQDLLKEADELISIFVVSLATSKKKWTTYF